MFMHWLVFGNCNYTQPTPRAYHYEYNTQLSTSKIEKVVYETTAYDCPCVCQPAVLY